MRFIFPHRLSVVEMYSAQMKIILMLSINCTHINLNRPSMLIICMIPLEKLDKCGLMLANPDRDLYMTCM